MMKRSASGIRSLSAMLAAALVLILFVHSAPCFAKPTEKEEPPLSGMDILRELNDLWNRIEQLVERWDAGEITRKEALKGLEAIDPALEKARNFITSKLRRQPPHSLERRLLKGALDILSSLERLFDDFKEELQDEDPIRLSVPEADRL
jgi:hypothetical protein